MRHARQQALFNLPDYPLLQSTPTLIRFCGAKGWLAPLIRYGIWRRLLRTGGHLIEPFGGSLAVSMSIGWPRTVAGDISPDLIGAYREIQLAPLQVADALAGLAACTPEDDLDRTVVRGRFTLKGPAYWQVRDRYNDGLPPGPGRAAAFLYLLARCFNGVLRVNRRGRFNVPVGDVRAPCYRAPEDLAAFARVTASWEFALSDFGALVDAAGPGDAVFADPPYSEVFTGYALGWSPTGTDQARLVAALARARDRGAAVIYTDADCPRVRESCAAAGFAMLPTAEPRAVSREGTGRKRARCLLITSDLGLLAGGA